ncbi:DUF5789 family protein [Haladaptatus halobius]|uniref:DUF5789 family protein n=1 Tax=Haladaptatus halobius TaxID=2884875 RepID=UPI001D0BD72D|nr:hypothetical protein [Haladaptatus halobius]
MTPESSTTKWRELGVDFGEFGAQLEDQTYPITTDELLEAYREYELDLAAGTETVEEILEPLRNEQYDSAAEVRQTVLLMVGDRAIGRKYYSDRTPPAMGEYSLNDQLSF